MSDGSILSHQKGVFRVNCIDCLDRTNVVEVRFPPVLLCDLITLSQSAFARHVLQRQLGAVALLTSPEAGRTECEIVFNDGEFGSARLLGAVVHRQTVWANNGDAVSRA